METDWNDSESEGFYSCEVLELNYIYLTSLYALLPKHSFNLK